jgi:hypothetical protein
VSAAVADLAAEYAGLSGMVERHEAGHVVVAWSFGYVVDLAEVARVGDCGSTRLTRGMSDPEHQLVLLAAGVAAERTHRSYDTAYEVLWRNAGEGSDFELLRACVGGSSAAELEDAIDWARDEAWFILREHRGQLDRVAVALGVHRRLGRVALDALREG